MSTDFEWLDELPDACWVYSTLGRKDHNISRVEQIVNASQDHHLTLPAEYVRKIESRDF